MNDKDKAAREAALKHHEEFVAFTTQPELRTIEYYKGILETNPKWLGVQALELLEHYIALEAEVEEWRESFELYDDAMRRGTRMWQQANDSPHIWPDGAKLIEWLMTQLERFKSIDPGALRMAADELPPTGEIRAAHLRRIASIAEGQGIDQILEARSDIERDRASLASLVTAMARGMITGDLTQANEAHIGLTVGAALAIAEATQRAREDA